MATKKVTPRLTFIEYGIFLAYAASCRATCPRAHLGCVVFDKKRVVAATGYNGAPPSEPQCDEIGCLLKNDHCLRVTHGEKNAIIFAGDRDLNGGYAFTIIRPCRACFDLFANRGIQHIYYVHDYHPEELVNEHFTRVCKEKGIIFERFEMNVPDLVQKTIDFQSGPAGEFSMLKHINER